MSCVSYDDQGNRLSIETRLGSRTDSYAYSYYANSDRVRTVGDRAYVYDLQNRLVKVSGYEGRDTRVRQNDSEMEPSGNLACLYRSLQASAEEKTGRNMTVDQINEATEALLESGAIGPTEYYPEADTYFVNDPVAVITDDSSLGEKTEVNNGIDIEANAILEKDEINEVEYEYMLEIISGVWEQWRFDSNDLFDDMKESLKEIDIAGKKMWATPTSVIIDCISQDKRLIIQGTSAKK